MRQLQKYLKKSAGLKLEIKNSGSPAVFVVQDKKLASEKWKIFGRQFLFGQKKQFLE